jgi:branched-subunit amino acid transport protein
MTAVWVTIAALAAGTIAIKAAGPLAVGGRELSERARGVVALVAPALLAALVLYETVGAEGGGLALDERVSGVGAAVGALLARLPMVAVIAVAAAASAAARLLA